MEFEKAMEKAQEYLTFTPRFIDPGQPQGLWFCDSVAEVSDIQINAVCLGSGSEWDDVVRCRPFLDAFPFLVIVTPNAIAREAMVSCFHDTHKKTRRKACLFGFVPRMLIQARGRKNRHPYAGSTSSQG